MSEHERLLEAVILLLPLKWEPDNVHSSTPEILSEEIGTPFGSYRFRLVRFNPPGMRWNYVLSVEIESDREDFRKEYGGRLAILKEPCDSVWECMVALVGDKKFETFCAVCPYVVAHVAREVVARSVHRGVCI